MAPEDQDYVPNDEELADDEFSLDMPTEDEQNPFYVADGEYAAVCTDLFKDTSGAGNRMWVFEFEILEEEPDTPHAGQSMRVFCALTPAALWKLYEVVEAMDLGAPGTKTAWKRKDAIGRRVILQVEQGEYDGRPTSNVAAVLPHPDGAKPKNTKKGKKKSGGARRNF